jgi:thymidylate synthase
MRQYLELLERVMTRGKLKPDRTGIGTISFFGCMFEHDMAEGFPLITTRQMAKRSVLVELEGFIGAKTSKRWFRERGCHFWDRWCNRSIVSYSTEPAVQARMAAEDDLGPIYGFPWRHSGAEYLGPDHDYTGQGEDQLANLVNELKRNPHSRRLVVSAWNPAQFHQMAIEPCHDSFQVNFNDGKLDLNWRQRSVDLPVGFPSNLASYAMLLSLLCLETGHVPGRLIASLGDVHIYNNQLEGVKIQLQREPRALPHVKVNGFKSLFEWKHTDTEFLGYNPHPKIAYPLAV